MTAMEDVPQGVVRLGMPCKLVTNVQCMEGCVTYIAGYHVIKLSVSTSCVLYNADVLYIHA